MGGPQEYIIIDEKMIDLAVEYHSGDDSREEECHCAKINRSLVFSFHKHDDISQK